MNKQQPHNQPHEQKPDSMADEAWQDHLEELAAWRKHREQQTVGRSR